MVIGAAFQPGDKGAIVRVVEVVDNQADATGVRAAQGPGHGVGRIAHFGGQIADFRAAFLGKAAFVIQREGDC